MMLAYKSYKLRHVGSPMLEPLNGKKPIYLSKASIEGERDGTVDGVHAHTVADPESANEGG